MYPFPDFPSLRHFTDDIADLFEKYPVGRHDPDSRIGLREDAGALAHGVAREPVRPNRAATLARTLARCAEAYPIALVREQAADAVRVLVGGALGVFAYTSGHARIADYLLIPHLPGVGELAVLCGALVGAGLGFLWFNAYPAQVFMGDVGALALGAALGTLAVAVRQEVVLFIMGGVFVVETLSVMIQVASFKLTGKRIFRMAPLHHHFELKGWPEPRVIVRFWIITVILVLIGLASLKIR